MTHIWFDMDGTIADLYGQTGWLDQLKSESAEPFKSARPLVNMQALARVLNRLTKSGYQIGIVSWLPKNASAEYQLEVKKAKIDWLKKHLKSVQLKIDILPYGTPKQNGRTGWLFDDEKPNRQNWNGLAFDEKNIIGILKMA